MGNKELDLKNKMAKIKYKIVVEHKDKGFIEIPIPNKLLHGIADVPFIMGDCEHCWETFILNKIDKDVKKFFDILMFLAFDVEGDGYAYQTIEPKKKDGKIRWKKIKSDFVLVKKPKYKKTKNAEEANMSEKTRKAIALENAPWKKKLEVER